MKPAFGGIAKTSILVSASPVLYSFEEDVKKLQFASDARKISNSPEIDLKLVVPNALKVMNFNKLENFIANNFWEKCFISN